jgi:hypothetical protein
MIAQSGWGKFWGKAERRSIPADIFAIILWMAEVVNTFGVSSQPASPKWMSVQLSPGSLQLALQYSRNAETPGIVPQKGSQVQKILSGARVTEAEFLTVVTQCAAVLDDVEDAEILSQMPSLVVMGTARPFY